MRPMDPTSMGCTTMVPPASAIRAAVASASSVATYVVHRGGSDGSICGAMPAAASSRVWQVR
jgi:hypothetical protein